MSQTSFTITDNADLANDIKAIDLTGSDSAPNTSFTFTFALSGGASTLALTQELDAINLAAGSSLTIIGNGDTIAGGFSAACSPMPARSLCEQILAAHRDVHGAGGTPRSGRDRHRTPRRNRCWRGPAARRAGERRTR